VTEKAGEIAVLQWLVAVAILYALVVVTLVLSGYPGAKDWRVLLDFLPAWMSAVGTLGTLAVAYMALQRWRQPDDARRRGDTAQELLRLSRNTENALFAVRTLRTSMIRTPQPTDEDIARMMKRVAENLDYPALREANAAVGQLDTYRAEAGHMFGLAVQQKIDAIIACYGEIDNAADLLRTIGDSPEIITATPPNGGVEGMGKMAREAIEVLGGAWMSKDMKRTDEFGDRLRAAGNELRELLVAHLPN
jgi:hypothetical protein